MTNGLTAVYNERMNGISKFLISAAGCDGGFNWYGFLIGTGMVICIVISYFNATKRGYYKDLVFDIAIICIPLAIFGARLYYVVFDTSHTWTFKEFFGFNEDGSWNGFSGLAIYGGLIFAVLGGVIVHFWKRKKPPQEKATFLQMADLAFVVIFLGQAIGRWGNFANQEAFGNFVSNPKLQWFPYAVKIDSFHAPSETGAGWYQATFFYESLPNLIGFGIMMWLYNGKRQSFDGFLLSFYLIWYGIVRVIVEGFRSDSLYIKNTPIRVSQALSAVLIVVGLAIILTHVYLARTKGKKPFILVEHDKLCDDYYGYDKSILSHPNVYDKTKKEKSIFARMFSRTESPDPVDSPEDEGEQDNFGEEDAEISLEIKSGEELGETEEPVEAGEDAIDEQPKTDAIDEQPKTTESADE